jgi:predicted nucleic acid-binding protein
MIHLLDVNVLLALHYTQHVHHSRALRWGRTQLAEHEVRLASCSITELGFVRIASGPRRAVARGGARMALSRRSPGLE